MRNVLFLISFFSFGLFAQTNAYLKKGELQIGEQTELVYEFIFKEDAKSIQFQPFSKIIPCQKRIANSYINSGTSELEIMGKFKDTILAKTHFKLWRGTYKITVWDSGQIVIPETTIIYQDSSYAFNPLVLSVSMPKTVNGQDIYDIKESFIELENEYWAWFKSYWWAILIFLILVFMIYKWAKKKRVPLVEVKRELSLKDRTLLALEGLEKSALWKKEQMKEHYIELSFIFKSYLAARYDLNLLEKTSYETGLLLAQKNLKKDTVETIKIILDYSDLVKFAKAKPGELDVYKNLAQVRQIVAETSPLDIHLNIAKTEDAE